MVFKPGPKTTSGQWNMRSTKIVSKALGLPSYTSRLIQISRSANGWSRWACSFGFTELFESLKVVDRYGLASRAHNTSLVPVREQPADGKQRCTRQLGQLFPGKPNLEATVHPATQLIEQSDQLMTQSHGNSFRRDFAVSFFEFMKLPTEDVSDIPSQVRRSQRERLKSRRVPNKGGRGGQGQRCRAVPVLGPQSHRPNHFPRSSDPENHFRATLTQLHDFGATRGQQHDSSNRIAFEEYRLAASKVPFVGRRSNFPTLRRGDIREQRRILN